MRDLHPYDGVERRFHHDDRDPAEGRGIVARVLRIPLPAPPPALRYELSFYSGGIGIVDRLRVSIALDSATPVVRGCGLAPLAEGARDVWFVEEEEPLTAAHLAAFVEENRASFQPAVATHAWFDPESSVNGWTLVYYAEGAVHYLAYDQG